MQGRAPAIFLKKKLEMYNQGLCIKIQEEHSEQKECEYCMVPPKACIRVSQRRLGQCPAKRSNIEKVDNSNQLTVQWNSLHLITLQ